MPILEIPIKFQKSDVLYTTKQVKLEHPCPICEGKKTIKYNDKDMRCPECMGKGFFVSDKSTYVVCDDPYVISKTKISIDDTGAVTVKYKGCCGLTQLNRAEYNLFLSKEDAQISCDDLNRERIYIGINDIIVPDSFKNAPSSIEEIRKKLNHYEQYKKLDGCIVVNNDNVLQKGYINYKVFKMLNVDTVKVVVE